MRQRRHGPDYLMLAAIIALSGIGLLMVFSASTSVANARHGDPWYFARRQLQWLLLGAVGMAVAANINIWSLRKLAGLGLLAAIVLVSMTFLPQFAVAQNGSARWVRIGGIQLQPSEVAKLALLLWTADKLARKGGKLNSFLKGSASILLVTGVLAFLVAIHDLGTAVAITLFAGVMLFSAGVPWLHLLGTALVAAIGMVGMIFRSPYRLPRVTSFINPWLDAQDTGYHLVQSLYAIGPGGLFGRGLGKSIQKEFFLPEPHNDFIFSVLAEELGFIGGLVVLALFLFLAWRGIRAALQAPDAFSALLACGVTSMVVLQAAINIAVVTGSVPITGITLPLVSYGGSSLLITMVSLGILLSVTRYSGEREEKR